MSQKRPLREAQDAKTSPERLALLAHHEDSIVREAVAQNPNTPLQVLYSLAEYYPQDFLQNPLLPLLLLENPNLWESFPEKTSLVLLKLDNLSKDALLSFSRHSSKEVRYEVSDHTQVSSEALSLLSRDKEILVRRGVARNPKTPAENLRVLCKDTDERVRINVAGNPNTPGASVDLLQK
jgi:hypothetical protein